MFFAPCTCNIIIQYNEHFVGLYCISTRMFNFSTRRRWWPYLLHGKSHGYPLDKRLGGSTESADAVGNIKISIPLRNLTPTRRHPA